ncbi:adenylate cyclase [Roseimicrobium gellanilyticum]|uniref:Adenylate cyclase n=1 Tax=Roseimicrobium gellanilyticum TaxID=748857 RepID=A0A366HKM1_9BACT|nr:adenylate/guanylate cyclase domain-containing protein [Roseimicrobium gellanilyticum]RBP42670.1 adenylate cyclase [Roseimicrobium gellanilyticum]
MRYRTKLSIALVGVTALSCGLLLWLVYHGASDLLFKQVQGRVLAIASTGALNFPVEEHERLRSRADETSADYLKVEKHLRAVRDTNQDPDMRVIFVYTMRPSIKEPGGWDYIADGEEQGSKDKSHIGDPVTFQGIAGTELILDKAKANPDYTMDEFGVWLTASVPLRDASGKSVGLMAVDVAADSVRAEMRRMLFITMGAVAIASVLSLLASLKLAKWASSPLTLVKATLNEISSGNLEARINLDRDDEFGEVGRAVNRMALSLQERAALKGTLSRSVPGHVAERLASARDLPALTGKRQRITVMFCDIHNFTRLSATLEPEKVFGFLNEFFEEMIEAIFQHHGSLDKMLGDGLMALFGAPEEDPHHAVNALEAAMDMQARLSKIQQKWIPGPSRNFSIGIGLHTGDALVGNLGSKERMEYTAIGETVRIAARLEAATEENRCAILLSRDTASEIPVRIPLRQVNVLTVRGLMQSMAVFTPQPTEPAKS